MEVLLGILVVIGGFATRRNPLLVVATAGIVTGLLGGLSPAGILRTIGDSFASSRSVSVIVVTLPVIGLLEHNGLQRRAARLIDRMRHLTAGRILVLYLLLRQVTAAAGLQYFGGPAQTIRPLISPMAENAAARSGGVRTLPLRIQEKIRSHGSGADTIGLFFGGDCFPASAGVLIITGTVAGAYAVHISPVQVALWSVPLTVCALIIHGARLLYLERGMAAELSPQAGYAPGGPRPGGETSSRGAGQ
ncbi:5-oxoproline transporter, DUF969 family subunit [Kitasatospora sp. NPDC059088]|uniref:5-oxoproline transporter, DUF969 family subunit n=1 Tax=Kitasatospora sp. NPDC059088 TaxID=3346722 RepID=UPI00368E0BBF